MKNKDRYKDQIYDEVLKYCDFGVDKDTKEPHLCNFIDCEDCLFCDRHSCLGSFKTWLEHEEILDDVEKKYLRNLLEPFKKYGIDIVKDSNSKSECLFISLYGKYGIFHNFNLPPFKKGSMYNGMQLGACYKPEELGLW